jgi:NADP-reducing hydrogenase subunit HndC
MAVLKSPSELEGLRSQILARRDPARHSVAICAGTGCLAMGVQKVIAAFKDELARQKLTNKVEIKETGCPGFCEQGPVLVIRPGEICYVHVRPEDVSEIVSQTIVGNKIVERLLYVDPASKQKIVKESDIPFYKHQERLILGNNGLLDPRSIDDYIALGGYSALAKAFFNMTSEKVMKEVGKANLRGRGGGGFPTFRKWETTKNA